MRVTVAIPGQSWVEIADPDAWVDILLGALAADGSPKGIDVDDCEMVVTEDQAGKLVHLAILPGGRIYSRRVPDGEWEPVE